MDYLQQFKALPKELQEAISSEEKMKNLEELEKKYGLKLAKLVVRLMVKDIKWPDLESFLVSDFKLRPARASELKKDLAEKIFNEVLGYLTKDSRLEVKDLSKEKEEKMKQIEIYPPKADEIRRETIKTDRNIPPTAVKQAEIVKNIKEKTNLVFEDEILARRFENIISSYLRDVRNDVQLKETLSRAKKIGGLELPKEKITEIIGMLKELRVKSYELKAEDKKEFETLFTPKPVFLEEEPIEMIPKPEVGKKPSEIIPSKAEEEPVENKKPKETTSSVTTKPIEIKKPQEAAPVQIRRPMSSEKRVEDISLTPRALGPVEELSGITLVDLQRWGGGQKTSQIILDKINLLQEESLLKRAEGIRAWQESPLFRLYLEIGQEAMERKKTLAEMIEERKIQKLPYLETSDWQAIAELNRKLRF